jgi:hypothetical protein
MVKPPLEGVALGSLQAGLSPFLRFAGGRLGVAEKGYEDLGRLGQDEPASGSSQEAPKHQSTKATKHLSEVTKVACEPWALDGGHMSTPPPSRLSERYSVSI